MKFVDDNTILLWHDTMDYYEDENCKLVYNVDNCGHDIVTH